MFKYYIRVARDKATKFHIGLFTKKEALAVFSDMLALYEPNQLVVQHYGINDQTDVTDQFIEEC